MVDDPPRDSADEPGASGTSGRPTPERAPDGASEQPDTDDATPGPGRRSVAESRRSSGNKLTLILGGLSIVAIIVVIVAGFWMNARATAIPDDGYGLSQDSTVRIDDQGVLTVSAPASGASDAAPLVLDFFVDAMDPDCADLERQFHQQIAKAIDDGRLIARYHVLDYLNQGSVSGDYSTRAFAALLDVARIDGDRPGAFMAFYSSLWEPDTQPEAIPDGAKTDLDNAQLADLAGAAGASQRAQQRIADGAGVADARADAAHSLTLLKAAWDTVDGPVQTPTVVRDGTLVSLNGVDWLTDQLGGTGA